ncbi:Crotonase, core [Moelleriella libera RCEF 2490]|uniref:Crotonase, core n=1 Tax=Moelleriella libera RCEF 2490 TaxID=1081109 RepID=A0A168D424_9HYPO|nr:Crotonase, core [Moelleriella libera RCEF 2490]
MSTPLFSVPIAPCGPQHPGGTITCTEPRPAVYLLTWISPPDNRLTVAFCRALLQALDIVEFGGYKPGVVVTTSGIPKFYSNGLDLELAINTEGFWQLFYDVWVRFLTYPMPTVALLNGHTFAGGLMLAQTHDYRLAPSPKGFLCLNEAVEHGLADATASSLDDALAFVADRQLVEKPAAGVYGVIKTELHKDLLAELRKEGVDAQELRFQEDQRRESERREFGKVWFQQYTQEEKKDKAKL